ncbi:2-oxo-4-hydroxy-4-carboxy-5-ureidoimidazoline decarboxylase [Eumeta japonica]|uniref:2-oxo-4-hydroxy-4-carboxy-5-ureidoimidazoline decarboxylase n=1 Tax=Eumeta variegata TaxID=151549 RepID=A0A4C1SNX1_EUMVA|nr:2-oxo-4-hydroxy-4-carboxy-5-ureidoimidazoline decarboxylase [Eumeta japonica]
MMSVLTIDEVNSLGIDQFVIVFGNVIELCTDAAAQVYNGKPFRDTKELCQKFSDYLDNLSEKEKVVILDLHPDLAGRLAIHGQLTHESAEEQRSAGLMDLTVEQRESMNSFNER